MKNIKQQFSDLRNNTPKHVQWLLLAAAFIVVLILLTLLLSGRDKSDTGTVADDDNTELKLVVTPDETIDFSGTPSGEVKTDDYIITASGATKIINVRTTTTSDDLLVAEREQDCKTAEKSCLIINQNCTTQTVNIDPQNGCRLTITFYAKTALKPTGVSMIVDYRGAHDPDIMKKSQKLMVVVGAQAPKAEIKKEVSAPAPEKDPEPEAIDDIPPAATSADDVQPEPISVKDEIKQEIEAIAPTAPILAEQENEPAPVKPAVTENTAPATQLRAETCSDFAFPGYNASGRQIGWIRPERGAYYFHPYSDTNCDTPTGIYNPDNGIISDIKNSAKKIGTDAEHIGYAAVYDGALPQLSNPVTKKVNKARQSDTPEDSSGMIRMSDAGQSGGRITLRPAPAPDVIYSTSGTVVASTQPYDRTFILRQYKPIPATIVSDVRADTALEKDNVHFPVQATVDRNVYSDNGRTIIIPTGTLLLGYVTGEVPGPYKSIGRMNIKWYQFVLPNGVEFNFAGNDPVSADSQGRIGVPGRGTTDYLEQFVMPMLTAIVPAAVNMIAPIADKFVNQIDLDNNTVVQSGTVRSSELAKNEIITAWNQVAQKLMVDMMDNTTPPFTIPAGTRITVYSPDDLAVVCPEEGKPCSMSSLNQVSPTGNPQREMPAWGATPANDGSWVGQARSFSLNKYCVQDKNTGIWRVNEDMAQEITQNSGYSYSTVTGYCQSLNYQAINNVKQEAVWQNQQSVENKNSIANIGGGGSPSKPNPTYNEQVLGLKYDEDTGAIQNPFQSASVEEPEIVITCPDDGTLPDANGCCTGEIFTDMGEQGFNCCPETGGDCFPPIK